MFRGITATTLDVKGRITIPTKYRDEIAVACEGHLVVTADIDRCLLIYPFPEWSASNLNYSVYLTLNAKCDVGIAST